MKAEKVKVEERLLSGNVCATLAHVINILHFFSPGQMPVQNIYDRDMYSMARAQTI